jgi:N-acetylmuramoyl-L-alanine amidase
MKFGIDKGHNVQYDTGANGIRYEDTLIKEVGDKVISKLRTLGHTVIDCTPTSASSLNNSLWQRCNTANSNNVDEFISIHFNFGGGRGTEVYAMSSAGRAMAQKVLEQIVALGFVNRRVKDGSHLYVIKNTNAPAILVECAFVDSVEDMRMYDAEKMANAITSGLTGQSVIVNPPAPSNPGNGFYGDEGVAELQRNLNRLNIKDNYGNALVVDGIMGSRTVEAVKRLQSIAGITIDGIPGPQTLGVINSILMKPLLSIGSTGVVVRYLQFRVGTTSDGIFGNATKNSVVRYQSNNGLDADGIVGNNTWSKLIG